MLSFLKRSENIREHRVVRLARLPDINRALQVAVCLSKKKSGNTHFYQIPSPVVIIYNFLNPAAWILND